MDEFDFMLEGFDPGVTVVRRLADRIKDQEMLTDVSNRFRAEEPFRRHATRFMSQFERLLNQAGQNDPEELLSVSLLTADVGKIYLALSKATERL